MIAIYSNPIINIATGDSISVSIDYMVDELNADLTATDQSGKNAYLAMASSGKPFKLYFLKKWDSINPTLKYATSDFNGDGFVENALFWAESATGEETQETVDYRAVFYNLKLLKI